MRFLWLTDSWGTLDHQSDTTLRLIEEATNLGHECFWGDFYSVYYVDHEILVPAMEVRSVRSGRLSADFDLSPTRIINIGEFHLIMVRADPPIRRAYVAIIQSLYMWSRSRASVLGRGNKVRIVNSPEALLTVNSKVASAWFPGSRMRAVITKDPELASAFGNTVRFTVLKPLNSMQSVGVCLLKWRSAAERSRSLAQFAAATSNYIVPVMLQQYLDVRGQGELRYWCVNGEVIAVVHKISTQGKEFVDVDKGDVLRPAILGRCDIRFGNQIGEFLTEYRVALAAVDTIAGIVTDINVVSPGLLSESEKALGKNLACEVIERLTGFGMSA